MSKEGKRLTERIVENAIELPNLGRSNRNMALFLAQQEEIRQALDDGWNVKTVWHTLHKEGKFPATYCCFLLYVKKFIREKDTREKENRSNSSDPPAQPHKEHSVVQNTPEKKNREFQNFIIQLYLNRTILFEEKELWQMFIFSYRAKAASGKVFAVSCTHSILLTPDDLRPFASTQIR